MRIYNRLLSVSEIQDLYLGLDANFISPETAYIGEEIQFIDISTSDESLINWEWDFENDGIYDSFVQNPTYIYSSNGIYSVKLRISSETLADSLIKDNLITVTYCPPASPDSVQVNIVYPDAIISWLVVNTTECGSPIIPDGYIIRYNETASELDEDYYFLNFTTQLTYTHTFVAQYSPQMFYRVIAVKDYSREQIEYLEGLNNSREKIKWSIVQQNLKEIK